MANIVWMSFPVRFHLRKEIGFVDALGLADGLLNCISFLVVECVIVGSIEAFETCLYSVYRFIFGCVRPIQRFDGLPFEKRQ